MKRVYIYIIFSILTLLLCFLAINVGAVDISNWTASDKYILYQIRIPRTLMCLLSGATLAVCGAAYQSVFENPLADPYVIGVSSGASFGAALGIVIGLDCFILGVPLLAFIVAMITVAVIMKISQVGGHLHTTTLLLAGISINFLFAAIISILMFANREEMHKIYFWTMGSFEGIKYIDCIIVFIFSLIGIVAILCFSKQLNALLLGSMQANSLGVDSEKVKKRVLVFSTLMTSVVVSFCGVIGFVGLVVPHIVRLLVGNDNRCVVPISIFGGMIFMLLSDIISRALFPPAILPIGAITSLIGAPFFIYLLYNAKKKLHF